jgi:hypothetical protein
MPVSPAGNRSAGGSAAGEALSAQAALLAGLGLKFAPLPEVTVGPDQSVTFILPRGFRRPLIQRSVMLASITGIGLLLSKTLFAAIPFFSGPFLIGYVVTYIWRGRFRTLVTPEGIMIRSYFDHFVPWHDYGRLEVRKYGTERSVSSAQLPPNILLRTERATIRGGRSKSGFARTSGGGAMLAAVFLVRTDGRVIMLRAPLVANWKHDPYFDNKVQVMRSLAALYTGASPGR